MKNEILNPPNYKKTIIGEAVLYVNKMSVTALKNYSEKSTVSGDVCISNKAPKAVKITLEAGICVFDDYENTMVYLENSMRDNTLFDVQVGKFIFPDSEIILLKFSDSTENGFVSCSVTLASQNKILKGEN